MIIISSPLGFNNCTISFQEIDFPEDLDGCISYVGHPNTKVLLEALGAETMVGRWNGPELYESYLAVPLANNPRTEGYTVNTAIEDVSKLKAILCTRVA